MITFDPDQGIPIGRTEATVSIPIGIILSIITCGIYILFWNARQMRVLNSLLEEQRFNFWAWVFLSLITCGLYHIYYEYKMGEGIKEIQGNLEKPVNDSLSLISLVVSLLGVPIVADAIHQHEINKLFK